MSRKKRTLLIIAPVSLFLVAAWTPASFARFSRAEQPFSSVHAGDSRASVLARLGKPNFHAGACGVIQPSRTGCAMEYVYSHPFAPIVPEYYIVSFSADDQVMDAEPWDSP